MSQEQKSKEQKARCVLYRNKFKSWDFAKVALILTFMCGLLGAKEPNRCSVITLKNEALFRIFYSYRCGKDNESGETPYGMIGQS